MNIFVQFQSAKVTMTHLTGRSTESARLITFNYQTKAAADSLSPLGKKKKKNETERKKQCTSAVPQRCIKIE